MISNMLIQFSLVSSALLCLSPAAYTSAFTINTAAAAAAATQFRSSRTLNTDDNTRSTTLSTRLHMSDAIVGAAPSKLLDDKGTEFTVGCIIETTKEVKAFQIARKAYGRFSEEDGSFIPLEYENLSEVPRFEKCLVMPVGFRGTVTRVYDIDEFDATQPIIAKFFEGETCEGDFAPPMTFMMHFDTPEINVVE